MTSPNQPKKIASLEIKDATHRLRCRHAIGRSGYGYYMSCIILKRMSRERLKLLVFGDRYWKGRDHKKQIRYVDAYRVSPIPISTKL